MHTTFSLILRSVTAVLVVGAAAVLVAACGGSGASSRTSSGATSNHGGQLEFASCVRAHGISEYPDSGNVDNSGNTTAGTATVGGQAVPQRVLLAAETKCARYNPGFVNQPIYSAAQMAMFRAGALRFSECMRAHGVADYPDMTAVRGPGGHGFKDIARGTSKPLVESRQTQYAADDKCNNLLYGR